jgi:hypothetical protein
MNEMNNFHGQDNGLYSGTIQISLSIKFGSNRLVCVIIEFKYT